MKLIDTHKIIDACYELDQVSVILESVIIEIEEPFLEVKLVDAKSKVDNALSELEKIT